MSFMNYIKDCPLCIYLFIVYKVFYQKQIAGTMTKKQMDAIELERFNLDIINQIEHILDESGEFAI